VKWNIRKENNLNAATSSEGTKAINIT